MNYNLDYLLSDFVDGKELAHEGTREAFGLEVIELAKSDSNIVVLNANLESSLKLNEFAKQFPAQSLQVGVAEQNMANIATGLALYGKIPMICSFAAFSPALNYEQIRVASYSNANIKIISSHYGLNIGPDGVSAQMTEDISLLRAIPNMTIITPADSNQTVLALRAAVNDKGPIYVRLTRNAFPVFSRKNAPFNIGKSDMLCDGKDITIIATGSMVYTALEAAKQLELDGVSCRVINMHTIKPIDVDAIVKAAKETGGIVTVEEHQVNGGLGSAVSEVVVQNYPVPMRIIGVPNTWGESGTQEDLFVSRGLTVSNIIGKVREVVKMKTI